MDTEEMNAIMEWIANDINKIDFVDQCAVAGAFGEFVAKVKPIYTKYAAYDEKSTFLFKM